MYFVWLAIAVAIIVSLFLVTSQITARQSHWRALEKRYRFEGSFMGRTWTVNAQFPRGASYDWMSVGGDEAGLYMKPAALDVTSHSPLRIPWTDVEITHPHWVAMNTGTVRLGPDRVEVTFGLGRELAEQLLGLHAAARK